MRRFLIDLPCESALFQVASKAVWSCQLLLSLQLSFCWPSVDLSEIKFDSSFITMCKSAKQERDTLIFRCVPTCGTDLAVTNYIAPFASLACTAIAHCSSWLPKPPWRCQICIFNFTSPGRLAFALRVLKCLLSPGAKVSARRHLFQAV